MLRNGKIRPSKGSASAPIVLTKQGNGKLRIVEHYHGLNLTTIKNKYALPWITMLMEQVATS